MENEEIAVKITALEHETKSAKHRIDDLESQNQAIQDLALSVKELTINMGNMLDEQRRQGKDIENLKAEPANKWKHIVEKSLDTVIGIVVGALVTGLILMIAQNLK